MPSEEGAGRRLSHVFSFQSISPLGPGGLPPAQAARSDSSLSKEEVAFAEPNKGIEFLTFKLKSILFCSPSSEMGERKSKRGGHWLPPHLFCQCWKGAEPIWEQGPSDRGTSHQHASSTGDRRRRGCIQARRVCLHLRKDGEQVSQVSYDPTEPVVRDGSVQFIHSVMSYSL